MKVWKALLLAAVLAGALWFLSPSRAIHDEPGLIEISFLGDNGPNSTAVDDAIRVFESESRAAHARDPSQPAYRVLRGQNASRDLTADPTRFLVSVAGGEPPDLILFDRYAVSEWAARGAFLKLDPFIARDLTSDRPDAIRPENYYRSCWEEVRYDGATYGVPERVDDRALFYNKDMLKRAGYVDAQGEARPPQTWEELAAMAPKLTERDARGQIERLGFAPNFGNAWLYFYAWMNGGAFLTPDAKTCTLNSPPVVQALEWMTQVYDTIGGAPAVYAFQSSTQVGQLDPFTIGRVAMKIDGYWNYPENLAQFGSNLNYGVAVPPLPAAQVAKGRAGFSWVSGWCFAIPSTARKKEAGWELLRFLCSQRAAEIIGESNRLTLESQGRLYVPTQNGNRAINEWLYQRYIASNPSIPDKVRDGVKLMNDMIDTSPFRPVTPVGQLLFNEQKRATENAIFHKLTPQASLDESTRVVQREIDRVLSPPRGPELPWRYFLWIYAAMIVAAAAVIYWWETRPSAAAVEGTRSRYFRSQWRGGWLTASPWIIGFIVLTGGPILFSIVISFCDYDILNPARFVGLTNYRTMLTQDPLFWKSIGNTFYMVLGIPLGMALSLAIAMLLNLEIRGVAVWRTFFYLPSIVPAVASSILWIWIFNPNAGLMNHFLLAFGIHGPNWLQDEQTSKPALILMGLWSAGGGMII
ncbi:MAG: extracellular solute-binding protein, partial [Verrucomicrobiota bacterium]|nr:extracellular solute-binding protein [Verrucomicrobiota bacterium]